MATTFPNSIQTFTTMINMTASDGDLIKQYQEAMEAGLIGKANNILGTIPNSNKKIINAGLINNITDTLVAVQQYYADKFSNGYFVGPSIPSGQSTGDFWFKITREIGA